MSLSDGTLADLFAVFRMHQPEIARLAAPSSDAEFEQAFSDLLRRKMLVLEANRKTYASMGEDDISSVLADLMTCAGVAWARRENHHNGHVDLTFEFGMGRPQRTRLGEAKIYNGPEYHMQGLHQLMSRYLSGRERRAVMISYVKGAGIADLTVKVRTAMDEKRPEQQQAPCEDHQTQWAFTSAHRHSSGETIVVDHYACNLHHPG